MNTILRCASGVAIAITMAATAQAADYKPPLVIDIDEAPRLVPVEIGSGWYLRGDVGYNFETDYENRSIAVSNPFTAIAPFSSADIVSASQEKRAISGSVGVGYHVNDILRLEAEAGFLSKDEYSISGTVPGGCGGTQIVETVFYDDAGEPISPPSITESEAFRDCGASASATNTAWNAMVNAYVDLGTVSGFTPYIGAGIGLAYTPHSAEAVAVCHGAETEESVSGEWTSSTSFICDGASSSNESVSHTAFRYKERPFSVAYSLSAGFAYQMGQNTKIDVGYRYVSAPNADYISVGRDGVSLSEGLDYHQVRVGLRYDLW